MQANHVLSRDNRCYDPIRQQQVPNIGPIELMAYGVTGFRPFEPMEEKKSKVK